VITGAEVAIFYVEALTSVLIPILIVMSAVKFALVVMFYMHLKFDHRLFTWLFVGCLTLATSVVLALMALFGVLLDTPSYEGVAEVHGESKAPETSDTATPHEGITHEIGSVSGDDLTFDTEVLTASSGAEVVLTFSNNATTQQHNWVLVQSGTKDDVATAGLMAAATGWIPTDDERVLAYVDLISPGGSGEVRFTAPAAGTYQFVCTFPGHNATMFGTFEVSTQ
jgi:azurin